MMDDSTMPMDDGSIAEMEPVATTGEPGSDGVKPAPAGSSVRSMTLGQLSGSAPSPNRGSLDLILEVELDATVELGRSRLSIRDILALGPGSVVELDKLAGEPADLLINGKRLARGEIVVIDDDFGIRITEILTPAERLNSLR